MDDTLSRHGRDGAGTPIWRYAGTRTRAALGGFRQRGLALPIRFSDGDLVWDQVAIRPTLYSLRCAALYFSVSPARIDGPSTRYFDAPMAKRCSTVAFGSHPGP